MDDRRSLRARGAGLPGAAALGDALRSAFAAGRFGALLLMDVDDFAALNRGGRRRDGDRILASLERTLADVDGTCFRVAGDDFAVLYDAPPRQTSDRLLAAAEELRERLAERVLADTGARVALTAGGVAHPGPEFGDDERMADLVLSTAEAVVIRAKRAGKDRTLVLPAEGREAEVLLPVMVEFFRELARINRSVALARESESRIDSLTGLQNRKAFDEALERVFHGHARSRRSFALLCLDTDSLKSINDSQGHDAGDRFLLDVTRVLRETVRVSDVCSRWGGDEFAIVAEGLDPRGAQKLAERIRRTVEDRTDGTVSIGVFCGSPASPAEALKAADQALYEAKRGGKNRVSAAPGAEDQGSGS